MAKRRTKDEQIADLKLAQARDLKHAGMRADAAELKSALGKRDYARVMGLANGIANVAGSLVPKAEPATEPASEPLSLPEITERAPVDRKSAAAGAS